MILLLYVRWRVKHGIAQLFIQQDADGVDIYTTAVTNIMYAGT